jgi:archaellum component FlaF (FlaF/FlaG flagellin family)
MKYFTLLIVLIHSTIYAQIYTPKNIDYASYEFASPLKIKLEMSDNYGEIRSNHFHSGIDFKTQEKIGLDVVAIEDGYISRLLISPFGYGNALYIDHKNGLTSVYGHLDHFNHFLDSLAYSFQKNAECFAIDTLLLSDSIFVQKGQVIGFSGNSGNSFGPHLHFEIRETITEESINPLLFNCFRDKIVDHLPPLMNGVKVYAISDKGYLIPGKSAYYPCTLRGEKWVVNENKPLDLRRLKVENGKIGIAFQTGDQLDSTTSLYGIYHSTLQKDSLLIHEQRMDYLNFDQSKFLNSHIDYYEYVQGKRKLQKNFISVINPMEIYPVSNGRLAYENSAGEYLYTAMDLFGNSTSLKFELSAPEAVSTANPFEGSTNYLFPDSVNVFKRNNFEVLLEIGSFHEPLQLVFKEEKSTKHITSIFHFCETSIPVRSAIDIRIELPELRTGLPLHKMVVARVTEKGELIYVGGRYEAGWMTASSKYFGNFTVAYDTLAPVIKPLDFEENKVITNFTTLELNITDNLSGVVEYKAYLNGNWVLMRYDSTKKRYIIPLDERSKPYLETGKNRVRIVATDAKNNQVEKVYTLNF